MADHVEGYAPLSLPRKTLLLVAGGGLAAASAITMLFVLPVEFGLDPTGFGRATGLNKLRGAQAVAPVAATTGSMAHSYPVAFRTDTFEIPLTAPDTDPDRAELEFKVNMKPGESLVYSWAVSGLSNPDEFYSDFHGEATGGPEGEPPKVVEYKQAVGSVANGALVAPINGVHGWYLQNQSAKPVVVRLKLSGFYELVPSGAVGNRAGIQPVQAD